MTTVAIIQARMSSTRLPGKVLMALAGKTVLARVVDAARAITGVDKVVVATSGTAEDDAIARWCADNTVDCYRGSLDDVLGRYAGAAEAYGADTVMRLTADCPLLDPAVCAAVLYLQQTTGADYASSCNPPSWPDGLDCEVFTMQALRSANAEATRPAHREHVTGFIHQNRQRFDVRSLTCPLPGLAKERWTLDTPEDFAFIAAVCERLGEGVHPYTDILNLLRKEPKLRQINTGQVRNAGLEKTIAESPLPNITEFSRSTELLARAENVIPLGSQTFSKSRVQYPVGHAPLFTTHGEGGKLWDVDGNEYVDLVGALLPVVLGYNDPDINDAVRQQMTRGMTFSLATELETQLAEKLCEIIPCAQMARFGKNGTDSTSAAIRLARAYTGRERIITCGYHGWQDWYIGSTSRNKGVPKAVQQLTHTVGYNNLGAVEALFKQYPGEIAAFILEPMNAEEPAPGYLEELKKIVHAHGALLVFDETITGFRYALGGAQELFGVTPDLATFGKAIANGMPISAIVGRRDVMMQMEEIFYSGTFGGETLSLAAALALIEKMQREPVIETLWRSGESLRSQVEALLAQYQLQQVITLHGKAPWVIVRTHDAHGATAQAIKTFWQTRMISHGVLTVGSHNICYAHSAQDIGQVVRAYAATLPRLAESLYAGTLEKDLGCKVLEPVFKVR